MRLKNILCAIAVIAMASVSTEAGLNTRQDHTVSSDEPMSVLWTENDFSGRTVILKNFLDINSLNHSYDLDAKTSLIRLENGAEIIFYDDEYDIPKQPEDT
ncbi:hypothetical protein [Vibrio quintilis]|uniref:Uncharacterized protein n=1 Tax=Vibrio quintilis TaxID=1117707 RepID=A0A1M7YXZ8_9VIBR|nr:hypothetical protein [Vibrio quintilis]SHO57442.1 hypothetical protein VQ7734_03211 [Vibrio quintilis]